VSAGAEPLPPRLYGTDADIKRIAAGLLDRTLPRADWTHEAHLAAISAIVLEHPEIVPEADMRWIISGYNEAVGGVNDDSQGYHETLTQYWIAAARAFHAGTSGLMVQRVNAWIASAEGRRDAPLRHYSRSCLFSVEARRCAVEPDLMRFEWNRGPDVAPAPQF
jgi:hypothetical protein